MMNPTKISLLKALYDMAREDRAADLKKLADQLGLSCVETDQRLVQLEAEGLVDADRVRLTMRGLTIAVASPKSGRRTTRQIRAA